jgi:hypothetical protein
MSDNNQIPNNPMEHEIPTMENPGFEIPPQPVQFTQPEFNQTTNYQPQFQQPVQYNNASSNAPKKKGKKKFAGILAAVVGVAACTCIAVFAGPKIIAALSNEAKLAPIDRFKNAITEVSQDINKGLTSANSNGTAIKQDNMQVNVTFDVTLGDYVKAMLPAEYSSISNLGGSMNIISKDDNQYIDLALTTQDNQFVSIEAYLDQLSNMCVLKVPELSPDYLSVALENEFFNYYGSSSLVSEDSMDSKELANLITEETNLFLSSINTVEIEEDVEVDASDVTAKYDKLTTTIEGKQLVDVAYDLTKRILEDQNFSKLINNSVGSSDELLEEIKSWKGDNSEKLTIDLYVDSDDKIVGFVLIAGSDTGTAEFGFLTAKDGKTGFEAYATEDNEKVFKLEGSYTDKSDVYSGKATLSVYEDGISASSFDLTFEDVSYGEQKFKGIFSLTSPELMGSTLKFAVDYEKEKLNVTLDVLMASSPLVSATFAATVSEADTCPTVPTDAVIYDSETQAEDYMYNADLTGLLQKIQDATGIDLSSLLYSSMYEY